MTAWFLTWLWQGMALAAGVSVTFRVLPRVSAATRHLIWCVALVTLVWLGWTQAPVSSPLAAVPGAASEEPLRSVASIRVTPLPEWALMCVLLLWTTVFLFRLLRILPGLHAVYRYKDACRPFPRHVEDQFPMWGEARGVGRDVRLMMCDELPGPAVLGFHDPCIAIPPSYLRRFTSSELDQIVLHEYGHVQRRDDWLGLLQALLGAALWIHPGAAWIGRQISLEREVACDDWVVSRTGAPREYARCLARVADIRRAGRVPAFAAAWSAGKGHLVRRVDRLLETHRSARRRPSMAAMAAGVLALGVVAAQLRTLPPLIDERIGARGSEFEVRGSGSDAGSGRSFAIPPAEVPSMNVSAGHVNSVPNARNVEPGTREPGTGNPEPGTQNSEPGTPNSEPMPSREVVEQANVIGSQVFEGSYASAPSLPILETSAQKSPWQFAGRAGVEVGSAARKAGVGVASSVTRGSLSIARVF